MLGEGIRLRADWVFRYLRRHKKFFVPEVVPISAMDCGPATTKSLLAGFRVDVGYERLREACQTAVDGTSTDDIERILNELGLEAEQSLIPANYIFEKSADLFPSLVVTRMVGGFAHFIVVWNRLGNWFQVMDPNKGRIWVQRKTIEQDLYFLDSTVTIEEWLEWALSDEMIRPLQGLIESIGIKREDAAQLVSQARDTNRWKDLAALDAAVRMAQELVGYKMIRRTPKNLSLLLRLMESALKQEFNDPTPAVPISYWQVIPKFTPEKPNQLQIKGAVIISIKGMKTGLRPSRWDLNHSSSGKNEDSKIDSFRLSLQEKPIRPFLEILRLLGEKNFRIISIFLILISASVLGTGMEVILLRSMIDIQSGLKTVFQQLGAYAFFLTFLVPLILIEWTLSRLSSSLGRKLELALRMEFYYKIPRLHDRFFRSRLVSDMAGRCHSVQFLREIPDFFLRILRTGLDLLLTVSLILIFFPSGKLQVLSFLVLSFGIPIFRQKLFFEKNTKLLNLSASLSRFYFDTLVGITAVKAHTAENSIEYAHNEILEEWLRTQESIQDWSKYFDAFQMLVHAFFTSWILHAYFVATPSAPAILLILIWVMKVTLLGEGLTNSLEALPFMKSMLLQLLEPLHSKELLSKNSLEASQNRAFQEVINPSPEAISPVKLGVSVEFDRVTVKASGTLILKNVNLKIEPGSHVAIVGVSGAGKSTLISTLLRQHFIAEGVVLLDGLPLSASTLKKMRRNIAWVDPSTHLWNRSLLENIRYGYAAQSSQSIQDVMDQAELRDLISQLPNGFQTSLGEGGSLVSGGEGQRVRLARALCLSEATLVLMDEPFRGLPRDLRQPLLKKARTFWKDATLLCVLHELEETLEFDRVLVLDHGEILEDGDPKILQSLSHSRFSQMLTASRELRSGLWHGNQWKRMQLSLGRIEVKE